MGAATASVLAPKQQQANKSKASKTKRLQTRKKSGGGGGGIGAEVGGHRSQVLLQEVQQRHLVVLPGLGAADAVSLVGVDLQSGHGCRQAPAGTLLCRSGLGHW